MNREDTKRRVEMVAVTSPLSEISRAAERLICNAGYDRLYKMKEEVDYIRILLHNVETNLDMMIMQKEEEDEIY